MTNNGKGELHNPIVVHPSCWKSMLQAVHERISAAAGHDRWEVNEKLLMYVEWESERCREP